jgi:hypothetical protein
MSARSESPLRDDRFDGATALVKTDAFSPDRQPRFVKGRPAVLQVGDSLALKARWDRGCDSAAIAAPALEAKGSARDNNHPNDRIVRFTPSWHVVGSAAANGASALPHPYPERIALHSNGKVTGRWHPFHFDFRPAALRCFARHCGRTRDRGCKVAVGRDGPSTDGSSSRPPVPIMSHQHPQRRHQDSLRLRHANRPPQPCRTSHSRIERCRPTTCQTQLPAGLPSPPSTAIACSQCFVADANLLWRPATQGRVVEVPVFRLKPKAEVLKDQVEFAGERSSAALSCSRKSLVSRQHDNSGLSARFAARQCIPWFPQGRPLRHHTGLRNGRAHGEPMDRQRGRRLAG